MVIFKNKMNQIIELTSTNYQFPNSDDKDWDGNWLQVKIRVIEENKTWNRIDPFLLTSDWLDIIEWFQLLSEHLQPKSAVLSFMEPNLQFEIFEIDKENDKNKFLIKLGLECVPDFHKDKWSISYEFELSSEECKIISEQSRIEYNKFPERRGKT